MTFTEVPFWTLTAAVFCLWLAVRHNYRATIAVLLAGSIVFYGYHYWPLLFLIFAFCLIDWTTALWVERSRRPRLALGVGVTFNLLVLGYWKYTPLLLRTFARLAASAGLPLTVPAPGDWIIPFGISFYSFTGIAYMVDVYRRVTPAERSLLRYTLSAMFFPHLVAGPILRPDEFLTKLRPEEMPTRTEAPLEAVFLLARGLFKKMVLADRIALAADPFFTHIGDISTAGVWALPYVYLYALQIYFDFSGYTDIARGLGLLFGFRWPDNFDRPYLATSVQDFWRRWHITLSRFLKDYLYVPLGGNRHGGWRTCLNLMITMLLGGLWHGASWSFMIWGGLHGAFLIVNRLWAATSLRQRLRGLSGLPRLLWQLACVALTFHCVCAAWCFFRLTDFTQSLTCIGKCFAFHGDKLFAGASGDVSLWLLLGLYGVLAWALGRCGRLPAWDGLLAGARPAPLARGFLWGFSVTLLLLALLLSPGGDAPPFIYFQF
jgi:alginate O-acetyltransferase complex protein AlgI